MRKLHIILLLGLTTTLFGQSRKAYQIEAEKSFDDKDYYSALSYYSEMLQFQRDIPTVYNAAESARLFDAYSIAQDYYAEVLEKDSSYNYPNASYYLALMQQREGQYQEAADQFKLFFSENEGENDELVRKAKKEMQSSIWAQGQIENPKKNIEIERLGEDVNTPFSEFGALEKESGFYFSSLRFSEKSIEDKSLKLYSKNLHRLEDQESISVDSSIECPPNHHIAHTTFNADETTQYYTVCKYLNDKDIRCDLYQRKKLPNGNWRQGQRLEEPINSSDSLTTSTMPHVAYDSRLGKEILYFVSNREGTKGGLDIYYSVINENGDFSQPMNLSGINTAEDDVTPFFHEQSSMLYFSSQGYLGMGGYDVYKVYQGGEGWGKVENLGSPTNTSYHEVYFTLGDNGIDAYMSSNRKGSLYLDGQSEACCYDIYEVKVLPCDIDLHAFTFDAEKRDSLRGVEIIVRNLTTGGEQIFQQEKLESSHYKIPIQCENEYEIIARKPGYKEAKIGFLSPEAGTVTRIDKLIYLEPASVRLEVFTFDQLSELALEGCVVRLFNLTTGEVETSPINIDGNDFYFRVRPCERYEVIANKDGYTQAQDIFEVPCELDQDEVIRKDLYLSTGLLDMLPIYLYFDNDYPNPRTTRRTTDRFYSQTYDRYLPLKGKFIDEYAKAYTDVSGTRADVEVSNFFDNEVQKQYERYVVFLQILEKELKARRDYDIVLKGFASPRASSGYNKRLGARRVDCVRNEFEQYNNGVFIPYIRNKTLRISEQAIGEEQAPPGVSDDLSNPVQSVYSPAASQERRVEIVDVKKVNR